MSNPTARHRAELKCRFRECTSPGPFVLKIIEKSSWHEAS